MSQTPVESELPRVCIGFHVDLASRGERRGWRLRLAVEALASRDITGDIPRVAACRLSKGYGQVAEEPVEYLDFGGTILQALDDPYGHRLREGSKTGPGMRHLPYFFHQDLIGEPLSTHHAIDGEAARTYPEIGVVPLQGTWTLPGEGLFDTTPLEAAVEEARRLASSRLLLGRGGWYVASDLPHWEVYEYNGRQAVMLTHRSAVSAGNIFAIDRQEDALAHGRRLHGGEFELFGEVQFFDPTRRPEALADPCILADRLASFLARHLRPQLASLDRADVERWHDIANASSLMRSHGIAGARQVLAACETLFEHCIWSKSRRHEQGWRGERLRLRTELEAAPAALPAPGAP